MEVSDIERHKLNIFSLTQHQELKLNTYIHTHVYQCTFMSTCVGVGQKTTKGIMRGKKRNLKGDWRSVEESRSGANWERKGTNHKWGIAEGSGREEQWTTKYKDTYVCTYHDET